MKPASSSALTRRRHGGAEMPTRLASSTLVMRPSDCSSLRIFQSMASRRAGNGGSKELQRGQEAIIPDLPPPRKIIARQPGPPWDRCGVLGLRILHSSADGLHWLPGDAPAGLQLAGTPSHAADRAFALIEGTYVQ